MRKGTKGGCKEGLGLKEKMGGDYLSNVLLLGLYFLRYPLHFLQCLLTTLLALFVLLPQVNNAFIELLQALQKALSFRHHGTAQVPQL